MLVAIPAEATLRNAVQRSPEGASATDFIGRRSETGDGPLAFLVDGPAGYVIPPHFHSIDQFQVFVGGSATLGRNAVRAGSVHYADSYTPYGPITATAEGFQYLTLRPPSQNGYCEMPGGGALVGEANQARGHRGRMITSDAALEPQSPDSSEALFAEPDGVSATSMIVAAGERLSIPNNFPGGAFLVVLSGDALVGALTVPSPGCIWIDPEDRLFELVAGSTGIQIILVSFARRY